MAVWTWLMSRDAFHSHLTMFKSSSVVSTLTMASLNRICMMIFGRLSEISQNLSGLINWWENYLTCFYRQWHTVAKHALYSVIISLSCFEMIIIDRGVNVSFIAQPIQNFLKFVFTHWIYTCKNYCSLKNVIEVFRIRKIQISILTSKVSKVRRNIGSFFGIIVFDNGKDFLLISSCTRNGSIGKSIHLDRSHWSSRCLNDNFSTK